MKYLSLPCLLIITSLYCTVNSKEIAITFDDAPRANSALSAEKRTQLLLQGLQDAGVEQAAFFIKTSNINDDNRHRLKQYQNAGHILANHSHSHWWLHKVDVDNYKKDILQADRILQSYKNFKKWYRYPYLDEGRNHSSHESVRDFLSEQGYINGYVTVDTYDWYMDHLYQKAVKADQQIDFEKLKNLYVGTLIESIDFYDQMAMKYLTRSPKHVLLLHENDIAAYFIKDLVNTLKQRGWTIISPQLAYQDPIAKIQPKTLFKGQGRVAAIAHDTKQETKVKARELISKNEDEGYLDKLFLDAGVFSKKCSINQLAFISGSWQDDSGKTMTRESWNRIDDGSFKGYGEIIDKASGENKGHEALMITEMDDEIFYIAKPSQSAMPTAFRLKSCEEDWLFENMAHDFPKQLRYKKVGDDIQVDVSDAASKGFTIKYNRVKD